MKMYLTISILLAQYFTASSGVYFSKLSNTFTISDDTDPGDVIGKVYALSNYEGSCGDAVITYKIVTNPSELGTGNNLLSYIAVNKTSGDVILVQKITRNFIAGARTIAIGASCQSGHAGEKTGRVNITVTFNTDNGVESSETGNGFVENACWFPGNYTYEIEENSGPFVFGILKAQRLLKQFTTVYSITKAFTENETYLSVNTDLELTLLKPLDREKVDLITTVVSCQVSSGANLIGTSNRTVTVRVLDLNDNPPLFQHSNLQWEEINSTLSMEVADPTAFVLDRDLKDSNDKSYKIHVNNDKIGLVRLKKFMVFTRCPVKQAKVLKGEPEVTQIILVFNISSNVIINSTQHIDIEIVDSTFLRQPGSDFSNTAKVRLNVFPPTKPMVAKTDTYKVKLNRAAARYSRLSLPEQNVGREMSFSINETEPPTTMLGITPKAGILYVKDHRQLRTFAGDRVNVVVDIKGPDFSVKKIVLVYIEGGKPAKAEECESGCSIFEDEYSCKSGCGFSAVNGQCEWRFGIEKEMNPLYSTCTPQRLKCPDRTCDELEQLNKFICPQDCTTHKPKGTWLLGSAKQQGIALAKGSCWCDKDAVCTCFEDFLNVSQIPRDQPRTLTERVTRVAAGDKKQTDVSEPCDDKCKLTAASTVCAFIAMVTGLAVWWVRRRRLRRSQALKHVGSIASMSVLQSEYLEERDQRPSYTEPPWSLARPTSDVRPHMFNVLTSL